MRWIVAVGCAGSLAWFVPRARLGSRVRALAGVRLRVVDRAALLLTPKTRRFVFVGCCAGVVAAGMAGGIAGIVAGLSCEPLLRIRARRTESRRLEEQLSGVLRAMAAALRAGRSVRGALEAARDETPVPARHALERAVEVLAAGASIDEALDAFATRARSPAARTIAETIRIGHRAGPNLPAILDTAVQSLTERDRIARDRRAATAQARLSAAVVGSMPLAFFVLAGPSARAQMRTALAEPVGWIVLIAGLALEAAGAMWIRALARPR